MGMYTVEQLDYFARQMCTNYRILSDPKEFQDSDCEAIKERFTGELLLFSTVVATARLGQECHARRGLFYCGASDCPAWLEHFAEREE